jgi:hypothetical protein
MTPAVTVFSNPRGLPTGDGELSHPGKAVGEPGCRKAAPPGPEDGQVGQPVGGHHLRRLPLPVGETIVTDSWDTLATGPWRSTPSGY